MHLSALSTIAFAAVSSAHFVLMWPPSAGFVEEREPIMPCGGFTPEVNSSSTKVTVDQFAISIFSSHPQGQWAFRATTDTAPPFNFTNIVPLVNTTGIGQFCLEEMKVPDAWIGMSGVIQVIDNSVDGVLFQCAPVNFIAGSNSTMGPTCKNATGFNAAISTLNSFSGEDGNSSSSTTSMASGSPTGASATSSTSSAAAAMITGLGGFIGGLGLLAGALAL